MSTPYSRNRIDPFSLVPFDEGLLDAVVQAAASSPRRRSIVRFHEHDEHLQRMLNAIEPESYTRPHRHADPSKPEAFVALRGSVLVVRFSDDGAPLEGVVISSDGPVRGVEIPAGAWHSLVALRRGTVLFEVIQGPYDEATHKQFAPWAPPEEDREGGLAFIAQMRGHFEGDFPEIAALNRIEAEEDEIC
jgi:cupin fold WbuC family metalloprotein